MNNATSKATPLPLTATEDERGAMFVRNARGGLLRNSRRPSAKRDMREVMAAANAYGPLVEALRDAREGMRRALNPVGGDAKRAEIMRIDALLRSLGEIE